ncbi:MAG: DUF6580 family putative transport protein [Candidatus Kerfeldbacteria bacterium]|jgi:uncharacterized protein DUF6580
MKKNTIITLCLFAVVIAASFIMRVIPHPANFVPIGALALLSGVYLKSKWGVLLAVGVMMFSDMIIGLHSLVLFTWGSFLIFGMIGWWIRKNKNVLRVVGGTLAGSAIFYLITNFAVWAFTPLYSKTATGLMDSYYMAMPFFRSAALGDLFYVGIFFGVFEVVYFMAKLWNKKSQEVGFIINN